MTTKPMFVYWDSCVFISCLQRDPKRCGTLGMIVDEAKSGKIVLVASTMAVAETLKLSDDKTLRKEELKTIQAFFDNEFIEIIDVTKEIAGIAASIAREHDLKPPDAIHVATAIHCRCKCLQTYDGEDRTSGRKRYMLDFDGMIGVPPLKIELPRLLAPSPASLFDSSKPPPSEGDLPKEGCALPVWWMDGRARKEPHPLRMRFLPVPTLGRYMPRSIPACRLP